MGRRLHHLEQKGGKDSLTISSVLSLLFFLLLSPPSISVCSSSIAPSCRSLALEMAMAAMEAAFHRALVALMAVIATSYCPGLKLLLSVVQSVEKTRVQCGETVP